MARRKAKKARSAAKPGRRPKGSGDARADILDAALRVFAARGLHKASVREIARAAGADPALVYHYFDDKDALFAAAIRARIPPRPAGHAAAETIDETARRIVRLFFTIWDDDSGAAPLVALLRSATSDPAAAKLLRSFLANDIVDRARARVGPDSANLNVALVTSQLLGLSLVRHILKLEPVASASLDELVNAAAPLVASALRAKARP